MREESSLIVSFPWDKSTVCIPGMFESPSLPCFCRSGHFLYAKYGIFPISVLFGSFNTEN